MRLTDIRDALLTVGVPVSHYETTKKTDKYIVWAEDGQGEALRADNRVRAYAITGTVDYFTTTEYDPNVEAIERALNSLRIAWSLNSVQRETDTGYVHHEWAWEASKWLE